MEYTLKIRWTVSKARDTYGYNICTLLDFNEKYKCDGGGYDMIGTVFGYWLEAKFMEKIIEICAPRINEFYGLYDGAKYCKPGKYWLEGACGFDCMKRIAKAIGLEVNCIYSNKGRNLDFIFVREKKENKYE